MCFRLWFWNFVSCLVAKKVQEKKMVYKSNIWKFFPFDSTCSLCCKLDLKGSVSSDCEVVYDLCCNLYVLLSFPNSIHPCDQFIHNTTNKWKYKSMDKFLSVINQETNHSCNCPICSTKLCSWSLFKSVLRFFFRLSVQVQIWIMYLQHIIFGCLSEGEVYFQQGGWFFLRFFF